MVLIGIVFVFVSCQGTVTTLDNDPVVFADENLASAIKIAIDDQDDVIYPSELEVIKSLDLTGLGIVDLDGIEHLINLEALNLEDNQVSDVSPLAELEHLSWLSLRNNHITDLSAIQFGLLKALPLKHLSLRHNVVDLENEEEIRLSDISVLEDFTSLESLELRDLQITDISPLSNLVRLEVLDISQNPIVDTRLSALGSLLNLTSLNIRETGVTNLDVLGQLSHLTYLNIHSNLNLTSLSFLVHLTKLEILIAENVPIGNQLQSLSGLIHLQTLNLQNTGISDLTVIQQLMSNGALQDQNHLNIVASVNLLSNPLDAEDYALIDPYWHQVSIRYPYFLNLDQQKLPVINELMASNSGSVRDFEDDSEDWIELYNPFDQAVDLSGLYLSDDSEDLTKWAFPENTIIPAQGYLLVFASGKDGVYDGEYHTNFSLSKDGEEVVLTDSDGKTILEQLPKIEIPRDYTYGRHQDGGQTWGYFDVLNATPGQSNNAATPYENDDQIIPIDFVYNIESYDRLFNDDIEKSITIVISQEEWDHLDEVMLDYYDNFGSYRSGVYAKAQMIYQDELGSIDIENIGFRTRGGAFSRNPIQDDEGNLNPSHFKLSFHEVFDDLTSLNNGRTVFQMEELDMKWNRNEDSTYLSEKFALDLMADFGVYAAKSTLVKLYLKIGDTTTFYGVYTVFEPIDQLFLERRMTDIHAEGDLYKSLWQSYGAATLWDSYPYDAIGQKDASINYRPTYDIKTNKSSYDREALEGFIESVSQLNGEAFKTYIEAHFDVDRFIRYLAVNALIGNPDDYRSMGNNYYLYFDSFDEKWTIIPYDFDHGLGQGWNPYEDYSVSLDIYEWETLNGVKRPPLSDKILKIKEYQLLYESYLKELMDEKNAYFSFDAFQELFNQQKALYAKDLDSALIPVIFDLRNVETYMQDKIEEISRQISFYENNSEKRPLF